MIVDIIYFIGIALTILTGINLLVHTKKDQKFHTYVLALFFILLGASNGFYLLLKYQLILYVPHAFKVMMPLSFSIPVLAYWYVEKTLKREPGIRNIELLHFLPVLLVAINYIPFYTTGTEEKLVILNKAANELDNLIQIDFKGILSDPFIFLSRTLYSWIYIVLGWRMFYKFGANFKTTGRNNILIYNWIKVFLILQTAYYFLLPFVYYIMQFYFKNEAQTIGFTLFLITSLIFLTLSLYLLIKPKVFIKIEQFTTVNQTLNLSEEDLKVGLRKSQAYKNPDIKLSDVAITLELKEADINEVINQSSYTNFRDFINSVRFQELLAEFSNEAYESKSLMGIAKDYGFRSESTFYRAFKAKFNTTPQAYIKEHYKKD